MGDLKPCPFCGFQPYVDEWGNTLSEKNQVGCVSCNTKTRVHNKRIDAINEWNTRPTETQLRAELDRMTAAVIDGDWGPTMNERNDARAIREKYGFDK